MSRSACAMLLAALVVVAESEGLLDTQFDDDVIPVLSWALIEA